MAKKPIRMTREILAAAYLLLEAVITADTDEEMDALLSQEGELAVERGEKLERLYAVQRRAETEAEFLGRDIARLQARKQRCERARERVRQMAQAILEAHRAVTGEARVTTPILVARLQRGAPRLEHPPTSDRWPEAYVVQRSELDRARLKADLKAGVAVEGCALVQDEHVRWA